MTASRGKSLPQIFDENPNPKSGRRIRGAALNSVLRAQERFVATFLSVRYGSLPVLALGKRADLRYANMDRVSFRNRDLRWALLRCASFCNADFTGACMDDAQIGDADFTGAKGLTADMIERARHFSNVTLPRDVHDEVVRRYGGWDRPRPPPPSKPRTYGSRPKVGSRHRRRGAALDLKRG
jgi:hypothetical protein